MRLGECSIVRAEASHVERGVANPLVLRIHIESRVVYETIVARL
jgi:hypothetical protein